MLLVNNLSLDFNGVNVLRKINMQVTEGEIVALIGSNGSGKTTLLRAIMGLDKRREGTISFLGKDISNLQTPDIIACGLSLVLESRDLFPRMSVKDNLRLGTFLANEKNSYKRKLDKIFTLFPRLKERSGQSAGSLSGGEQQMLAISRALMQEPKLLLLDEPSLGLAPNLTQELFKRIKEINSNGTTILLVEQKAEVALKIAIRGYVLRVGEIVRAGTSKELQEDELVKRIYFGE